MYFLVKSEDLNLYHIYHDHNITISTPDTGQSLTPKQKNIRKNMTKILNFNNCQLSSIYLVFSPSTSYRLSFWLLSQVRKLLFFKGRKFLKMQLAHFIGPF